MSSWSGDLVRVGRHVPPSRLVSLPATGGELTATARQDFLVEQFGPLSGNFFLTGRLCSPMVFLLFVETPDLRVHREYGTRFAWNEVNDTRGMTIMTTIGSTPYFQTTQRYNGAERSTPDTGFSDQVGRETAQPNDGQSSRLTDLLAQADALQKRQIQMSNTDYLLAKFGIEEQIATERLNAGEKLDRYAVRVEGQVFNLAGKMYGPEVLERAKLSHVEMAKVTKLEDLHGVQSYLASRRGVDISA
jgi:hypothetical protein